ncbi:MAG: FixH family protein [Bacteroidia bacterium]|nr:FixH family protein [Bacteroidia bacterium]MDW8134391.1 FixH family protein [Bacteroidia bacterium]
MKSHRQNLVIIALFLGLYVLGCKKKEKDETHDHTHAQTPSAPQMVWVSLGHGHDAQDRYHVDLYGELPSGYTTFTEGYYRFRVKIMRGNTLYGGSDVRFLPMMYMRTHNHTCPVEQPSGPQSDGFYYGAAFFMMPTMQDEPWKLIVYIGADSVVFPIQVNPHPKGWVRRGVTFGNPNNPRYMYEMKLPVAAQGSQNVTFYVYYRNMSIPGTDPQAYPPATQFSRIRVETWMPSMGHGSPGSEDALPVSNKPGVYAGKAGFNMRGDWRIYATFIDAGGNVVGRDSFDLNF